jgi:CRISPR type IV-associated protein Csf3
MPSLRITAHVPQQIVLRQGLALDALLLAVEARRRGLPPLSVQTQAMAPELPIPLAKSPCGRLYLCSHAQPSWEQHEQRYQNRRFPLTEARSLSQMKRVDVGAGPQKTYRIPYSAGHLASSSLVWYAIGEREPLRALLAEVTHLGKRRSAGYGRVAAWDVSLCEPWEGFPVLREGCPLRPLPLSWPGLDAAHCETTLAVLSPPYWDRAREVPAAVAA